MFSLFIFKSLIGFLTLGQPQNTWEGKDYTNHFPFERVSAGPGKPMLTIYKWLPHVCVVDGFEGVRLLLEACSLLNTAVHTLAKHLKGKSTPE